MHKAGNRALKTIFHFRDSYGFDGARHPDGSKMILVVERGWVSRRVVCTSRQLQADTKQGLPHP